jgi:ATP/maltotriose-dependent transcriptional regulator MalT
MVDVGIGSLRFDGLRALCDLEFKQGNLARARECLRFALPDGPATQPSNYYFYSTLWLFRIGAALAIDERDAETARRWIDAHDQWLDWSKRILDRPAGMLLRATCHVLSGERADAYAVAEAALAQSLAPRQPLALLATHRFLGQLDLAEGRHESAARHLDVALRMTEQCAAQYDRALTLLALAELALATSDVATARDHLAEVRRICIPLEARPLIQRADALDERLDDLPRRVSNLPLSVREIEVLRLVARGLSNSEVGDLLFISPRTVAQHLQSIYNKLGISSRTAAAAFAFEHNLTDREPLSS